jgi:hypothetical protein
MKNIFKKLFANKNEPTNFANAAESLNNTKDSEMIRNINIPENLFVDNNHPTSDTTTPVRKSGVKKFLEINHQEAAFLDGYNYHSGEVMSQHINAMASKFRQLIEIEIQHEESEITVLQVHYATIGLQFADLNSQLKIKIEEKKKFVSQYREQMIQSIELEGWVSNPIMEYKKGFQKGLTTFLNEKGFLDSYQIL